MLHDSSITKTFSRHLVQTIRRLAGKIANQRLVLMMPKVAQQTDGASCGYFAVANLTSIVLKLDPRLQRYSQTKLKGSLLNFVERIQLELFPKNSGRAPTVQDPIAIEI